MSTLRNRVQLVGHLGMDPEMKTLQTGMKLANFRMATREVYFSNGEWKEDTQWHRLTLWGKLAERAETQLKKGSFVMLEGKLEHRNYVDAKGETKYTTEVRVANFILLDKKQGGAVQVGNDLDETQMVEEDGLPF